MLPSVSEAEGCRVLSEAFVAHGYAIVRDAPFDEDGVAFVVDGWDAAARVGFEYRTHTDKADLSDAEIGRLGARMERGELYLFIVDDDRVPDADTLAQHAGLFLDEIATRKRPGPAKTKKTPAKKATTKKGGR